mgnify:CR=1 FL=1
MRPYGVKRKDQGCCAGHDKFSAGYRNESRKKLKARLRPAKKRPRVLKIKED